MTLRIGIGGLWHETNTFAPGLTTIQDFVDYRLADGPRAVRDALAGTATEIGGALVACGELGYEPVPFFYAGAVPGPTIAADARALLWEQFLAALEQALPLDGVLLALHGAMVAEDVEDPESDLIEQVRERTGSVPIAVVLDLHANPGDGLVAEADIVLAYETYPHTDAAERAAEAVRLLGDTIEDEIAPLVAGRRLALLTCPLVQATAEEPMASLLVAARRVRARPGVAAVSLLPGYAYADVERLGFAVVVTGEGAAASNAADELSGAVWASRDAFRPALASVDDAVAQALRSDEPIVLAEVADNVGGGAPGNATQLLGALVEADARGAVAVLHDPAAAATAAAAGEGNDVEVEAGDPPLRLSGRVTHAGATGLSPHGQLHDRPGGRHGALCRGRDRRRRGGAHLAQGDAVRCRPPDGSRHRAGRAPHPRGQVRDRLAGRLRRRCLRGDRRGHPGAVHVPPRDASVPPGPSADRAAGRCRLTYSASGT